MKRRIVLVTIVSCILASVGWAQTPSQMPQPGPEHKRLQYYAGTWTTEFEMKAGAGGKVTSTDNTKMFPGGFFAVTHTEGKGSMGELHEVAVMGYDSEAKVYTYDSYNNFGEAEHFKGSVQGDTWTWNGESRMGGSPMKMRFTAKEVSPTMYTMKLEVMAGANWETVMEGKSTKSK
jgi:hypothetical protein